MNTSTTVIDAVAVYTGIKFAHHAGRRVRVIAVHRFDMPESEIGPFSLAKLVIKSDSTLRGVGGLKPTDHLAVGLLNADGQWVDGTKYLVPSREVEFTQLPANWEELYRYIAHRHLSVGMLDTPGLAEALAAAYLAGARSR